MKQSGHRAYVHVDQMAVKDKAKQHVARRRVPGDEREADGRECRHSHLASGEHPHPGAPASREVASHPAEDGRQAETRELAIGTTPCTMHAATSASRVVSPIIGRMANSWRRRRDAATSPPTMTTTCASAFSSSAISPSLEAAAEPPMASTATLEGHGGTVGNGGSDFAPYFLTFFFVCINQVYMILRARNQRHCCQMLKIPRQLH